MTRSHLHLDRAATPWLIRRFIDPDASFEFVGWHPQTELPDGAIPFGVPGVELSAHDEHGTTFEKVMRKFDLEDRALCEMAAIVAAGVRWALRIDPPDGQPPAHAALGRALDGLGTALGVFNSDEDIIRISTPLYDSLYVLCQMAVLSRAEQKAAPRDPVGRRAYWRARLIDPAWRMTPPEN
ncbi:chromate resistance protein ChrB domain-containing protein [Streptomyces sp. NPDC001292]|uniref:chromate resistance protein ChrB domain-containing protein n=1 Tax=Streptomyces sp. NPDC001292 TaxID=3364558 RepID=UPI0036951DBF